MDTERYQHLADAYGADIGRWPPADREAALALRQRDPTAQRALEDAADLDHLLDAWRPPAVSSSLRAAVLASAPSPRPALRRFGFWLSGIGLAAACVAGVVVGVAGSTAAVSDARADELLAAAAPEDASTAFTAFTVSDRQVAGKAA